MPAGYGGPTHRDHSSGYFQEAHEKGLEEATFKLGQCYEEGEGWGVPQDSAEAERLYKFAAARGFMPARIKLGMLREQEGNVQAALDRYASAADQHPAAAFLLACLHETMGTMEDVSRATHWLQVRFASSNLNHAASLANLQASGMGMLEAEKKLLQLGEGYGSAQQQQGGAASASRPGQPKKSLTITDPNGGPLKAAAQASRQQIWAGLGAAAGRCAGGAAASKPCKGLRISDPKAAPAEPAGEGGTQPAGAGREAVAGTGTGEAAAKPRKGLRIVDPYAAAAESAGEAGRQDVEDFAGVKQGPASGPAAGRQAGKQPAGAGLDSAARAGSGWAAAPKPRKGLTITDPSGAPLRPAGQARQEAGAGLAASNQTGRQASGAGLEATARTVAGGPAATQPAHRGLTITDPSGALLKPAGLAGRQPAGTGLEAAPGSGVGGAAATQRPCKILSIRDSKGEPAELAGMAGGQKAANQAGGQAAAAWLGASLEAAAGGGVSSPTWAGLAAAEPGAAEGAATKRPRKMLAITDPKSAATAPAPASEPAGEAGRQAAAASTGAGEDAVPAAEPAAGEAAAAGDEAGDSAEAQQGPAAEPAAGGRAADEAEAGVSAKAVQKAAPTAEPGTAGQAAATAEAGAKPAAAAQADSGATAAAKADAGARPTAAPEPGTGGQAASEAEARLGAVTGRADGAQTQPAGADKAQPAASTPKQLQTPQAGGNGSSAEQEPAQASPASQAPAAELGAVPAARGSQLGAASAATGSQTPAETAGAAEETLAGEAPAAAAADEPKTQPSRPAVEYPSAEEARVMLMTAALQRLEVAYEEGEPEALAAALAAARAFPDLEADCASAQQLLELLQPGRAAAAGMGSVPEGGPSSQAGAAASRLGSGRGSSGGQGAAADSATAAAAVAGAGVASGRAGARHSAAAALDMHGQGRQEAALPLDARIRQAVAASTVWDEAGATSEPWQAAAAETGAGDGSHSDGAWERSPTPPAAAALSEPDAAAVLMAAAGAGACLPRPAVPPGFAPAAGQSKGPQQPGSSAPGALPAATTGLHAAEQPWGPAAPQWEPAAAGDQGAEQPWEAGALEGGLAGEQMLDVEAMVEALWESREPAEPAVEALQPVEGLEGEVATNFTDFMAMLLPKEADPEQPASRGGSRAPPSSPQPLDMSAWLPQATAQADSPEPEQQQEQGPPGGLGGGVNGTQAPQAVAGGLPGPIAAALGRMGMEAPKPKKAAKPQPTVGSERVGSGGSLREPAPAEMWGPAPANPAQKWPARGGPEGQQGGGRPQEASGAGAGGGAKKWADVLRQEQRRDSGSDSGALSGAQSGGLAGALSGGLSGALSGQSSSEALFPPVGAGSEDPHLPGAGLPARQLDSNNAWAKKLTVAKPDPTMRPSARTLVPVPAPPRGGAAPRPSETTRMKMNGAAAAFKGPAGGTGKQGSTGPPAAGAGEVRVLEVPKHWMNHSDNPVQKKGAPNSKPTPKQQQPAPPAPEVTRLEVSDLLAKQKRQHKGKGLEDVMARILTGQDTSDISSEAWDDLLSCPISQERMKDPVVAADGHSYERFWISKWLENKDSSPMTGAPLEHKVLIPNQVLKDLVQQK